MVSAFGNVRGGVAREALICACVLRGGLDGRAWTDLNDPPTTVPHGGEEKMKK